MRSDVKVGSLLSGGLDSTLIVCLLKQLGFINNNNFETFSAVYEEEEYSELQYIKKTQEMLHLNSQYVYPDPVQFDDIMEKLLFYIEEPFRSFAVFSQFSTFRDAIIKLAPASAKPVAINFPIPLPPPVTIATLPLRSNISFSFIDFPP